jgi:hypothetical protein
MEKRQVLLEDGRYLIYYTFEDEFPSSEATKAMPEEESLRPEDEAHE